VKASGQRTEGDSGKAGAATDIQDVQESRLVRPAPSDLVHHGAKHLRSLILQPDRQVVVEALGIAVEQRPDIGLRHGFRGIALDAVDQSLRCGRIGGVRRQTAAQCIDRLLPFA